MGNYTTFLMFENPRRGRQARNFTGNDPKILDLKSSSEQIVFRKLSLGAPVALAVNFTNHAQEIYTGVSLQLKQGFSSVYNYQTYSEQGVTLRNNCRRSKSLSFAHF